ncbi:MAG: type VI secretion protein [Rhizobiaceae bacterium]|nr:type VI secretion protein [Rhizobiaceae bacterium]
MATCAAMTDVLERLACYDRLSRSVVPEPAPAPATAPAVAVPTAPPPVIVPPAAAEHTGGEDSIPAKREIASYLKGTRRIGDELQLTLIDVHTGEPLPEGLFDDLARGGTELERIRAQADFIMALPATPESDEAAALTVACRAGITEIRVYWPEPFDGQRIQVRLRRGESVGEVVTMRVKGGGYVFEAPRGLEAIRLIRSIVEAPRIQVLAGDQGFERTRSAFFEMKDLRGALGLQARICSWSGR